MLVNLSIKTYLYQCGIDVEGAPMIDRQNAVLKVKEIVHDECNPEIVYHVMEKTPDLHFHCHSFIGDDGKEYTWEFYQRGEKDSKGLIEYRIEFEEKSFRFPAGTVFHLGPESWRQEIPKSGLESIRYYSVCSPPEFDDSGNLAFKKYNEVGAAISISGEVILSYSPKCSSDECFKEEERMQVKPERVKVLFKDLLRCFSEVDCYRENWSDDTERVFTFVFCNGETRQYSGVFYYDENEKVINSEDIIRTFIAECRGLSTRIE